MDILRVENLRKVYKSTVAVDDVSFRVAEGVCFGLLGPNGAGKTTTMEIVEDIIPATSGTIYYREKTRDRSFKSAIGIQFQHTSLLNHLSVKETLQCYAKLYQQTMPVEWLLKRCDLNPILGQKNNQLSGGQRQRLMLALALINDPEVIFLDEPSTGLDPQSRRYLWSIVEDIKKDGKTVILTTHSMEEAEKLCDHIAIMDKGLIIAEGSPAELITTYCNYNTITLPRKALGNQLPCLEQPYTEDNNSITIQTGHVDEVLANLMSCQVDLTEMTVRSANLEDVFLQLTGRKLRD